MELFFWRDCDFASHAAYKDRCQHIVGLGYLAYRKADQRELRRLIDLLRETNAFAGEDPDRTSYERTLCLLALLLALCFAAEGKHDCAYDSVSMVLMIQDWADERQGLRGLTPLPASEVRWTAMNVLGDMKWNGEQRDRNRVMTPEELCDEWPRVYKRAMHFARETYNGDAVRIHDIHTALGWAGLQAIKTATRYCPERAALLVAQFNSWFKERLVSTEGHYRKYRNAANPHGDSVYYWDHELTKTYLAGRLYASDLDYMTAQRARLLTPKQAADSVYCMAVEREYALMKASCKLELVRAAG